MTPREPAFRRPWSFFSLLDFDGVIVDMQARS